MRLDESSVQTRNVRQAYIKFTPCTTKVGMVTAWNKSVSAWRTFHVVILEPKGRCCSLKMLNWDPEGRYCHRLWTAIALFWFSKEHLWTAITPFWLSTDDVWTLLEIDSTRNVLWIFQRCSRWRFPWRGYMRERFVVTPCILSWESDGVRRTSTLHYTLCTNLIMMESFLNCTLCQWKLGACRVNVLWIYLLQRKLRLRDLMKELGFNTDKDNVNTLRDLQPAPNDCCNAYMSLRPLVIMNEWISEQSNLFMNGKNNIVRTLLCCYHFADRDFEVSWKVPYVHQDLSRVYSVWGLRECELRQNQTVFYFGCPTHGLLGPTL